MMYDVNQKRVAKMLKLGRRYLNWIQNSVFEGEIKEANLERLKREAKQIMKETDSLIISKSRNEKWLQKEILGEEKSDIGNII